VVNNIILTAMAWGLSLKDSLISRIENERGQDLVEYAVLVGAIGIVAFGVLILLGPGAFTTMKNKIANCVSMSTTC
jgi:Flp pilus assembly pilin Flp